MAVRNDLTRLAPRVLIIEDAPDDAELLLRALRRAEMDVRHHVVDAPAAIIQALKDPQWDIVLADFNVPGIDFSTVLCLNQTFAPTRPLIVVSGSIGEETAVELMHSGVADLILKGNLARLAPAITRELGAANQEDARHDADERFRNIVEVTGDWIWETGEDHRFTFFSKAGASSWFDPTTIIGKTRWEVEGAEADGDDGWSAHRTDLDARRAFRNFRIGFNVGERRHYLTTSGVPFFDRDGAWRGYRGIARDETPIVEAYRRAEAAEALLHDAIDSISESFVIFDADDRIVMVNEAYRAFHPDMADMMTPGTSFEHFMRTAAARGVYPDAQGREVEWLEKKKEQHRNLSGNSLHRVNEGRWMLVTERRMRNGGTAGLRMDITALKAAEAKRDYLAYHDASTGLPNQVLFNDLLTQALAKRLNADDTIAVISLELTSLPDIRASQGLEAGDAALRETGRRIQECLASVGTVAHVGDGRYLAFSTAAESEAELVALVTRLLPCTDDSFAFNGIDVPLRIVMGVSTAPCHGDQPETLIRAATTALGEVKANPLWRYQFYRADMTKAAVFRWNMEADLRRAIEKSEFLLHFQPQLDTRSFEIMGAEALIRWAHPERGLIAPAEFIPIAEQSGLIVPIGEHALRLACNEAQNWRVLHGVSIPISVNLSAVQLAEPDLERTILSILHDSRLPAQMLKLELTESAILSDVEAATRTMRQLSASGVRFALDDFGMEHSSLSHLSRLPIDTLKVDYAFVSKMTEDRAHAALVQAIIAMTHSLGMIAIAEGVEQPDQLTYLQAYGCDALQGFLFSRPLPPESLIGALKIGKIKPGTALAGEDH